MLVLEFHLVIVSFRFWLTVVLITSNLTFLGRFY